MSDFSNLIPFFNSISTSFSDPNFFLEQYSTTLEILETYYNFYPATASDIIIDLGIGTGLLSFLAFKKGAKKIIGIDIDKKALKKAQNNALELHIHNLNLIHSSVEFFNFKKFTNKVNGIIMNPPFGTKRKYLDFVFLKKSMLTKAWILTLHKDNYESDKMILDLCKINNYIVAHKKNLIYSIPNTHKPHILTTYPVKVTLYLLIPNM